MGCFSAARVTWFRTVVTLLCERSPRPGKPAQSAGSTENSIRQNEGVAAAGGKLSLIDVGSGRVSRDRRQLCAREPERGERNGDDTQPLTKSCHTPFVRATSSKLSSPSPPFPSVPSPFPAAILLVYSNSSVCPRQDKLRQTKRMLPSPGALSTALKNEFPP